MASVRPFVIAELFVGIVCLALGVWSLLHGELHDALLGLGLAALSLFGARWEWLRSR